MFNKSQKCNLIRVTPIDLDLFNFKFLIPVIFLGMVSAHYSKSKSAFVKQLSLWGGI